MDLGLRDRVVLVAGASRGIGYAIAAAFLEEGAKVVITGRDVRALDEAQRALSAAPDATVVAFAGDMTDAETIERALDFAEGEVGHVHCAVANVGGGLGSVGIDFSDELWQAELTQNLTGSVLFARSALRRMLARDERDRRGSNVIFMSSISGVNVLSANIPYATCKAAMIHAAACMAREVGGAGIRVNVMAPGNVIFPGGLWEKRVKERPEAWTRWITREVPLRRFGEPREMADVAVWLASDRATYVTGATIVADGGQVR